MKHIAGGLAVDFLLARRAIARQPWSTAAIVLILAVGLSAARRATRVDPAIALRID